MEVPYETEVKLATVVQTEAAQERPKANPRLQ